MTKQTDREFFEERVFRPDTPCWNWRAYINRKGYGTWRRDGINTYVHRVAYELLVGPIPPGYEVHHTCCNRSCVNPDHLRLLTHAENIGAIPARTHCKHGHKLTAENVYVGKKGERICLVCKRESGKQTTRQRRAEAKGMTLAEYDAYLERRRTHCPKGHEFTEENTWYEGKARRCKTCRREVGRKRDGYVARGTARQNRTHCPHGHEYTPENTYTYVRDGREYRYCRECNRVAARARHARLKAAS